MDLPHALHKATPAELKQRLEAERRGAPFLLFRDGDGSQQIRQLGITRERLTIGRSAESDVPLSWDTESRACTPCSSTSAESGT